VEGLLPGTGARERNSTSPRAVAAGEALAEAEVVGAAALVVALAVLAAEAALVVARVVLAAEAALAVALAVLAAEAALVVARAVLVAEAALPGVLAGRAEPGPPVEGAAALGLGPLEVVVRRPEAPGSDPGHLAVAEARAGSTHPPRALLALKIAPPSARYWTSREPISPRARLPRQSRVRKPRCGPWHHRGCGQRPSC
jgi:hypothetical protein